MFLSFNILASASARARPPSDKSESLLESALSAWRTIKIVDCAVAVATKPLKSRQQRTRRFVTERIYHSTFNAQFRRLEQPLLQVFIEPGEHLVHPTALVLGFDEEMAFAGIDDELGRDFECSQRVPEFIGLRRRAFGIVFTDNDERR